MMDRITEYEKKQALSEFEKKKERQYKVGKAIITVIVTINIVSSIITAFTDSNFLSPVIQIALSIALFNGSTWVRYFFAVGAALGAFVMLYGLYSGIGANVPSYLIIYALLYMMYCVISSIILFTSKSVSEFLYIQKNG